ncbi:MAG TPA: hypothetical protein VGR28_14795 [Candidatus Thermoplasmatota archaeon]|jgi:hypothetical protein|nr:hypothetical protein [Candidatus Thermoplasmatota archaeon]
MLHILDGAMTAHALEASAVRGERLAWPEMFAEGPAFAGAGTAEQWGQRADYLEEHFQVPRDAYVDRVRALPDQLRAASKHDEVVLWFEDACWFCQANLLSLLGGPFAGELKPAKLSVVLSAERLGAKRAPVELDALFAARAPIGEPLRALASRAWDAYASPDPTKVEALLLGDFAAWPLLRPGLQAHLERFPSAHNGLNAIEGQLLRLLAFGPATFGQLFERLQASPAMRAHGLGDTQVLHYLWTLVKAQVPLALPRGPMPTGSLTALRSGSFEITADGRDVLNGTKDHVEMSGVDRWLGGVELLGKSDMWRWDGVRKELLRS